MNRITALVAVALFASACRPGGGAPPPAAASTGPATASKDGHGEGDGHGHEEGHGAAKVSDLDRPVEDLFADSCEHGKKTHECEECRYGVGVVRVPAALIEGGLVKTGKVARGQIESPVSLTGEVRFAEKKVTHLTPRAEGVVRAVRVVLGQKVEGGQPLLELESAALGEAESHYLETEASLRLARKAFERQAKLRDEGISSEKEFLTARQEHEAAGIRAQASADRLRRMGLSNPEIEALAKAGPSGALGRLVVRAPATGTILEMHAVPGEAVRPDQSVFTIGDLSLLWVMADVYEGQVQKVLSHEGHGDMRATVTSRAFPDEVFPATVDFVSPSMDEKTRTLKVRVGVKNPKGRLRAGMFVAVQLFLPSGEEAILIPRAALLADEGRSFVFVQHHGDYWVRRPVETGRSSGDQVEVTKGLAGGETLVTEGCFLLKSDVLRSKMGAGCAD
jgi:cobalt-zinc-cadmium efflux system membrane fusion protein